MNKRIIITGISCLIVGMLIAGFAAVQAVNSNNQSVAKIMGIKAKPVDTSSMSMDAMTKQLEGKSGDEFDKAYLDMMVMHHQGAIDMAKLAKTNAKHEEIKKLSDDIITAQESEITQMHTWMSEWGYGSGSSTHSGH